MREEASSTGTGAGTRTKWAFLLLPLAAAMALSACGGGGCIDVTDDNPQSCFRSFCFRFRDRNQDRTLRRSLERHVLTRLS